MTWYDEQLHSSIRQSLRIDRLLHREKTDQQDLVIFENERFGRVLALDNIIQTTEGDEYVYHEMLAHVPILAHGAVRRVLVVGGGDGGCLREVLKHDVEQATLVEIDDQVIQLSKEHLPSLSAGAFEDPRTRVIITDGAKYVEETDDRFDVIVVDSTDPVGPGEVLFTERFYAACKRCLEPGGIVITQSGVPFLQSGELRNCHVRLSAQFADVTFYLIVVPTYNGGFMALGWASDEPAHRQVSAEAIERRYAESGIATRYYNPAVHQGAFALPNFIRDLLRDG